MSIETAPINTLANTGETAATVAVTEKKKRGRKPVNLDLSTVDLNSLAQRSVDSATKLISLNKDKFKGGEGAINAVINTIAQLEKVVAKCVAISTGEKIISTRGRKADPATAIRNAAFKVFAMVESLSRKLNGVGPEFIKTVEERFAKEWDGANLNDFRSQYEATKAERSAEAKAKREAKKDPNAPVKRRGRPAKNSTPVIDTTSPVESLTT